MSGNAPVSFEIYDPPVRGVPSKSDNSVGFKELMTYIKNVNRQPARFYVRQDAPVWEHEYKLYWENPEKNMRVVRLDGVYSNDGHCIGGKGWFVSELVFDKSNNEYWQCRRVDHTADLSLVLEIIESAETQNVASIQTQIQQSIAAGVDKAIRLQSATIGDLSSKKLSIERQVNDLLSEQKKLEKALAAAQDNLTHINTALIEKRAAQARPRNLSGYVYLLKSQHDPTVYKIGRTNNPENRLKTFNVKLPFPVQYEHLIATEDMYTLETELHQRFDAQRLDGEWFRLTDEDVQLIKQLYK